MTSRYRGEDEELPSARLPIRDNDLYIALAIGARFSPMLCRLLNRLGGANLTVCPHCLIDDFVHFEGCPIDEAITMGAEEARDLSEE